MYPVELPVNRGAKNRACPERALMFAAPSPSAKTRTARSTVGSPNAESCPLTESMHDRRTSDRPGSLNDLAGSMKGIAPSLPQRSRHRPMPPQTNKETTMSPPASRTPSPPATERIEEIDVSDEMQNSFLEYAYSVIYSRALPDARDGLKPVQRRILYQMSEMGLRPERGHVKSARVTGEVMGKLHPHGDASIYDSLVRLTQEFTMRVPLIDGHGNFGSLDDGPAAARYTEARLAIAALAMTENLDEDVVDFVPNYDNQLVQPDVLPSAFPNLLVNGASGIAVGMATNMAPHSLVEVVGAATYLIRHPEATLQELIEFMPGPDLPTGGTIVGLDGIAEAYATGRGAFKTRARVSIDAITPRKTGIVVTELPYLVGPERVIEKIKDGVGSKKLVGISDVTDLTDRANGLRLVIGVKTGFDAHAVLDQLYRHTPLEESFHINNVALVNGRPRTLGLHELLRVYVNHRVDVVTRRSKYRLTRRRERLHLVDGLLIAILNIDEVIRVIRGSDDSAAAQAKLIAAFGLSVVQAEYLLELRLRRLTRVSRLELEGERDTLRTEIDELEALLRSNHLIAETVCDELEAVAKKFGTPRRTHLVKEQPGVAAPRSGNIRRSLEIVDSPSTVYLSSTGRLIRVDRADGHENRASDSATLRRASHDALLSRLETTSRTEIGAITSAGRLLRFSPVDLPVVPSTFVTLGAGVRESDYLPLDQSGERVLSLVSLDSDVPIALGTKHGVTKRVRPGNYPKRPIFDVIALKTGDTVIGAAPCADSDELVFITSDAQLLRFSGSTVRPQHYSAGGMTGIRLAEHADALFFGVVPGPPNPAIVVATIASNGHTLEGAGAGSAKLSSFSEFPAKGRATGGVRAQRLTRRDDMISLAWVGPAPALSLGADGSIRELPANLAKRDATGARLDEDVAYIGAAVVTRQCVPEKGFPTM